MEAVNLTISFPLQWKTSCFSNAVFLCIPNSSTAVDDVTSMPLEYRYNRSKPPAQG